jgi:hypothetical protein
MLPSKEVEVGTAKVAFIDQVVGDPERHIWLGEVLDHELMVSMSI